MDDVETLADIESRHPALAEKLKRGAVTADEWAEMMGERKRSPESKRSRVARDLGGRATIADGNSGNGLPAINEMFRDEPTRRIAARVLEGGKKQAMMDDLLANGIPLKTGKEPREALVQDIPYVVRRLKACGYSIDKDGQSYVWRNKPDER